MNKPSGLNIYEWIHSITKHESDSVENNKCYSLINYVAPYYISDTKYKITDTFYSTIEPANLKDYLLAISNNTSSLQKKIYLISKSSDLNKYNTNDIVEYSRYLLNEIPNDAKIEDNLKMARMLFNLLAERKTKDDRVLYELVIHLNKCIFDNKREVLELFRKFINNKNISYTNKYRFIEFCLAERKDFNNTIVRSIFEKLDSSEQKEFRKKALEVFEDFKKKYIEESIYEYEEFPDHLIYETWSGNINDNDEINKLQLIAEKDLVNHPEQIKRYWNQYVINDYRQNKLIGKVLADKPNPYSLESACKNKVFLPINKLIEITNKTYLKKDEEIKKKIEFWEKMSDNNIINVKESSSTLHAKILDLFNNKKIERIN
ncbi:hypothetical protein KAH27_01945 [bacterium]|nr:hypothetical protein [bacterium]